MFVSQGASHPDSRQLINHLLSLAHNNYTQLIHYFSPNTISEYVSDQHDQEGLPLVQIPLQMLHKLSQYLENSAQILDNKFSSILPYGQKTEYDCLRTVWQKHHERASSQSVEDKFDSLNQAISMLKLRARQSLQQQIEQNQKIWESEYTIAAEQNLWSHPMFEIMSQKISTLTMKCTDLQAVNEEFRINNLALNKKHSQTESKIGIYKQRLKKMEKQMFEMAKKKAEIEKQILQKQQTKISKTENERLSIAQSEKQNPLMMSKKHSEYILLVEQQNRQHRASLEPLLMNSENIREKYRHAKNVSRRSTTMLSPNVSLDSIKSVKFQRTGGKKLIIKGS